MRALIVLGCVAIVAVAVVIAFWINSRVRGARRDRHELVRHQRFLDDLRRGALNAALVDPTSAALADEIAHHLANSKETR